MVDEQVQITPREFSETESKIDGEDESFAALEKLKVCIHRFNKFLVYFYLFYIYQVLSL